MTILKSLFYSNSQQVPTSPKTGGTGRTVDMPLKNKGPSVVARLMGLDTFPPETTIAEPCKENVVVDGSNNNVRKSNGVGKSSPKSKTCDAGGTLKDDFQARQSAKGAAECLQSNVQLDELNKQLLAKHMQVLDEINEAKRHAAGKLAIQVQRRGLSDSTEYMDAVELLEANRQFFEKYFEGATTAGTNNIVKVEKHDRRASYFRNGQSSPRPIVAETRAEVEPESTTTFRRHNHAARPSYKQLRESVTGEVLGSNTRRKTRVDKSVERPSAKDAKDIAKLIAKKIKEGIAKEVVKTFSPKPDTASSSPRTPHKASSPRSSGGDKHIPREKNSPSDVKSPRPKPESHSPRSNKSSDNVRKTSDVVPGKSPRSAANGLSGRRKTAPKLAEAASSSRAAKKTGTTSPKNAGHPRSPTVQDRSPKVSQRHRTSLDNNVSRTRDGSKETPKPKATQKNGPMEVVSGDKLVKIPGNENEAEDVEFREDSDCPAPELICGTDTKTPEKVRAPGTTKDYSPVSVLEHAFDDEEDVKEVILEPASDQLLQTSRNETSAQCRKPQEQETEQETDRNVDKFCVDEIVCPPERREELLYLRDLLASSDDMEDPSIFKLDSTLFEKLEERYDEQELSHDRVMVHSSAVKRWLIFDMTNEVLAWKSRSIKPGRDFLEEVWTSFCPQQHIQGNTESKVVSLVNSEMENWTPEVETSELSCQIEAHIFQELLEELLDEVHR